MGNVWSLVWSAEARLMSAIEENDVAYVRSVEVSVEVLRLGLLRCAAKGSVEMMRALRRRRDFDLTMAVEPESGNSLFHCAVDNHQNRLMMLDFLMQEEEEEERLLFLRNCAGESCLDYARKKVASTFGPKQQNLITCVEMIEQKFKVAEGVLYESVDNVLSKVSGMGSLSSWTRRYCIVLKTGQPPYLELCLFDLVDRQARSHLPCTQIWYDTTIPVISKENTKWFNSKSFTIIATGALKEKASSCANNLTSFHRPLELAALNQQAFVTWMNFFQTIARRVVVPESTLAPPPPPPLPSAVEVREHTSTGNVDDEQFEADLKLAMRNSLRSNSIQQLHQLDGGSQEILAEVECSAPDLINNDINDMVKNSASVLPSSSTNTVSEECIICFDGVKNAVSVPCGHNAVCLECAQTIQSSTKECPVCRITVREFIRLYHV